MDSQRTRFERLALPLQKDLYFAALTLTRQEADALDLVQDTYLRAYRGFDTYRTDQNFRGWMFTILRHAHLDQCRRRKIEPVLAELDGERLVAPGPAPAGTLEEALPDELLRALRSLSPTHQLLLQLADLERLSYKEIADVLGCPIGTVMSGLHNARTRLRDALARERKSQPEISEIKRNPTQS